MVDPMINRADQRMPQQATAEKIGC